MKHVKSFKWRSTKVKILTPKDIEKKWLGLIEAVWKWSENKPYVVILEKIIDKKLPTYWLVWKWITFDSGWIQVKPWDHMYEMKGDMCWAATAYALMRDLDRTELKVNMVTCIMLAENAVSSSSYRQSDILK
jgi:leucyl aminopeptidase